MIKKEQLKIFLAIISSIFLIGGSLLWTQNNTRAAGIINFGGRILFVNYCCNGGAMVHVGPPNPGTFYFQAGVSKLFDAYQIYSPGVWVLGNATYGGVCQSAESGCSATLPAQGTIMNVGTSLR